MFGTKRFHQYNVQSICNHVRSSFSPIMSISDFCHTSNTATYDCNVMAPDTLCQVILNRGKLWTAEYLKSCKSTEILNEIWENFINTDIELDNAESIEWIRYLMAGGYEPDYFTTTGEISLWCHFHVACFVHH